MSTETTLAIAGILGQLERAIRELRDACQALTSDDPAILLQTMVAAAMTEADELLSDAARVADAACMADTGASTEAVALALDDIPDWRADLHAWVLASRINSY